MLTEPEILPQKESLYAAFEHYHQTGATREAYLVLVCMRNRLDRTLLQQAQECCLSREFA